MGRAKRSHKIRCPKEYITTLRSALIDEKGRDRDVSTDVGAFMKFDKVEGLSIELQFATKLDAKTGKWALDLCKRNMQQVYNDSGYSWCDADKKEELLEHGGAARFLVARKKRTGSDDSHKPLGFVHFRFTLQGEAVGVEGGQPTLYVMDIQLEPEVRRQGLGRHMMRTLELIAHKQGMMHMMLPVVVKDDVAKNFALNGLKGYTLDDLSAVQSYDGQDAAELLREDATFQCFSKALAPPNPAAETSTPVKKAESSPSDGALSAAPTPDKAAFGFGVAAGASSAPAVTFDPTFGAAAAQPAASAADALLKELVDRGVIPEGMGANAKPLIEGLMLQFEQANGRAPNGDDIAKWLGKIAEHAAEDAEDVEDDEGDEDEDESDEADESSEDEEAGAL